MLMLMLMSRIVLVVERPLIHQEVAEVTVPVEVAEVAIVVAPVLT